MDNSNKHARQSNEEPDRISDLPDEILQRILSFLGTREAVQMSLQSKRWVNLWLSTPCLNFSFTEFAFVNKNCWLDFMERKTYGVKFKEFVETALYHRKSSFLHTFTVRFSLGTMCSELVHTSVSYAIKYNCRVFSMEAFIPPETLCACLFACKSLEEMCLRTSFCNRIPKIIPEVVNLPHIRKLHLKSSTIDRGSISRLLSGCPVLEELTLEGCYITCLCIFNHKFKYLHLNDCTLKLQDHKKYFYMKSYIQGDTVEATIRIGDFYIFFVWKIPNACQGDVNPSSFMQNFIRCFDLDDPFHNLSGVTILKLHSQDFQMLNKVSKKLGEFHNLKELCLSEWCMTCNFRPVALFLQNSPNIQSLTLHNYGDHCRRKKMGIHQMVDNSMLAEFVQCKKLKVIHIKSWRNHIKSHKLEEDLLPARQVFGNIEVILSQLYGFAFRTY